MGILRDMLDQIKVGDFASEQVGSDRYAYKVSRIEYFRNGNGVKAIYAKPLDGVRYEPSGYPVKDWKDHVRESEHERRFPVILSGRRKGRLPPGFYVGDDAEPYMDPSF